MHGPASSSFCRPHSCSFFYCLIKVWLPSIYIPLPPPVVHTENWCDGFQQDVNSFLKSVNEQWIDSNNKPVWILDITMIHDSEAHILLVVWLQVTDWKHWTAFGLSSPSQQKISVKQWTQALSILRCVCVCVYINRGRRWPSATDYQRSAVGVREVTVEGEGGSRQPCCQQSPSQSSGQELGLAVLSLAVRSGLLTRWARAGLRCWCWCATWHVIKTMSRGAENRRLGVLRQQCRRSLRGPCGCSGMGREPKLSSPFSGGLSWAVAPGDHASWGDDGWPRGSQRLMGTFRGQRSLFVVCEQQENKYF